MKKRWSPAQISRHLAVIFPGQASMQVVPETIYRDLYNWQGGALTREYCRLLRRRHLHRKPSRKIPKRRARFSGEVLMITDRPFLPTDRTCAGEWEGDLIMGRNNRSTIATLVERQTRFTMLLPVDPHNRPASVQAGLTAAMLKLHLRYAGR